MKLNTTHLTQWQRFDPTNGLIMPWFTHPFLQELETWDLHDKTVLEFGAGYSTLWWRDKAKYTVSIEGNDGWFIKVRELCHEYRLDRGEIRIAAFNEGSGYSQFYLQAVPEMEYDIIIIDGIYRTECCRWAVDNIKHPGIIIADNWQQDFVWISEAAEKIMAPYEIHSFMQTTHTNHEGRPWQTVYWRL